MPEGKHCCQFLLLCVNSLMFSIIVIFSICCVLLFLQNEEFPAGDALAQYENTKPDRMDFALVLHRGPRLLVRAYVYFTH